MTEDRGPFRGVLDLQGQVSKILLRCVPRASGWLYRGRYLFGLLIAWLAVSISIWRNCAKLLAAIVPGLFPDQLLDGSSSLITSAVHRLIRSSRNSSLWAAYRGL
jgi:hypothetical protein